MHDGSTGFPQTCSLVEQPRFPSSTCSTQYWVYTDLQPLMDSILQFHPGLEFLKETLEFQRKYAETVIYRIFYSLNR